KTPPSHGGNRGSIPLRATHCYFERDKQPNPEVVSMSDGILAIFLLSKTGIFYKYDMLQWNAGGGNWDEKQNLQKNKKMESKAWGRYFLYR
ncbi:MAG: hypothetical protein ACLTK4_00005, partial [Roseburia intestinalis]